MTDMSNITDDTISRLFIPPSRVCFPFLNHVVIYPLLIPVLWHASCAVIKAIRNY
jgi:hypothetical protein